MRSKCSFSPHVRPYANYDMCLTVRSHMELYALHARFAVPLCHAFRNCCTTVLLVANEVEISSGSNVTGERFVEGGEGLSLRRRHIDDGLS